MNILLDFIEMKFRLLPVESPGESITFLPPFVALVGTAVWRTSIWVSVFGDKNDFDGNDTVIGQFQHWRKFHVENRGTDISRAKKLIEQAWENYRRHQGNASWEDMVRNAEQRWLRRREQELKRAAWQAFVRDFR